MDLARKRGLAIAKGRCWEQQWRWLSFLKVVLCLLSEMGLVLLSAPTCIRPTAEPQEGYHWHDRHQGTCPAQGAQCGGWSCSPHHEVPWLEPFCKYIWRKENCNPTMWIIAAVYLREELELQIRWCFKLFAGNWNLSNKHHLCEFQHQNSRCRNPFTWKPVFFLKKAEGMLFNVCVNLWGCCLQWVTALKLN